VGKLLFQRFLAVQVALSNGKRALLVKKILKKPVVKNEAACDKKKK